MQTSKTIADYWDSRGTTYNRSWNSLAKKRLSKMETDIVENTLKSIAKTNKKTIRVLDIGIAIGRICEKILKYNVELYGTDISQVMIDICNAKFVNSKKSKNFYIHDVLNPIPKNWGKFDLVTAYRVVSYSNKWKQEIINIHKALNLNGYFIFTFPNKYSSHLLSTKLIKRKLEGCTVSIDEITKELKKAGFYNIKIVGYSRLLDSFYDWANSDKSVKLLYFIEKVLSKIFGDTLFVRLFYIVCQKKP